MTEANHHNLSISKKNKKLILAIFASFLLVATIIAIVTGVNSQKKSTQNDAAHAKLVKSTSSMADFLLQVNSSIDAAQSNMVALSKKLATNKNLDAQKKIAINDCLKNNERIVSDLKKVSADVNVTTKMKPQAAQDVQTKFSSCLTNDNSCRDGFSHSSKTKKFRASLFSDLADVRGSCEKALGMIPSEQIAEMAIGLKTTNRKLKEDDDSNEGGAEWSTDRLLFQLSSLTPDVVVAADGRGNYTTVSAAVAGAPDYSSKRYIIRIKAGVYRENVEVPKEKSNIMFLGDGRKTTIITGSRSVAGGSTTYQSATVAVEGQGFLARDITFQNTAGPSKYQAVALRVESDFAAFYKCGMLGYQNTLYTIDELKQKLMYTTNELESLKIEANEEHRKNKEDVGRLITMLKVASQERDEAKEHLQNILDKLILSNPTELLPFLPQSQSGNPSITESNGLSDHTHNHRSHGSSPVDSFFDAIACPDFGSINMAESGHMGFVSNMFVKEYDKSSVSAGLEVPAVPGINPADAVIVNFVEGKVLPQKGNLLQAVMETGPLLQTLLLAGPLPRWRNPPPL